MKNLLEKGIRCLLVQTKFSEFSFWNYKDVCGLVGKKYASPPLGLVTVAALLPQQWEFKLVDENIEVLLDEHLDWADIVCTGGMFPQSEEMLKLIDSAHRHGKPIAIGGADPTSRPDFYKSADYLVLNEGELTIPKFLEDLGKEARSGIYKTDEKADISKTPVPRFDLLPLNTYLYLGLQNSRGCPYNCEFCDIIKLYGRIPRIKKTRQIVNELQRLYELGHRGQLLFVDDNFAGDRKAVKENLSALKEWSEKHSYPFFFATQATMNISEDEQLLQLMKDLDFRFIFLGIETVEENCLKSIKKTTNVFSAKEDPVAVVNKFYSYGMIVHAGFIIGFDYESENVAENIFNFIQDSNICMPMISLLYALPGTQFYQRLEKENRIIHSSKNLNDFALDQTVQGLNFITIRNRTDILRDFSELLSKAYAPENYFGRILKSCLKLKSGNKHIPGMTEIISNMAGFFRICYKLGFSRETARYYWKLFFTVLLKNPGAIERAVSMAALFIHLEKQSKYAVGAINEQMKNLF